MELSKYVACICEGGAEKTIMELLLSDNRLIFTYDDLLDGEILRCRKAKEFEERYLRKGFTEQITVLRVLDSRRENFTLSKAYAPKIKVVNVITAPEIEMLVIFGENKYSDFKKSHIKPSDYCKMILGFTNVKSPEFVAKYFEDINKLISAIKEYKRVSDVRNDEYALADLLK